MEITLESQIALLDEIREHALKDNALEMGDWHSSCGTAHCLAGWAQTLNKEPTELKSARDVGEWLLPKFSKFFYGSNQNIRNWLTSRAYALDDGEVVALDDGRWIDNGCNYYDKALTQKRAKEKAASNKSCTYCTDCTDCADCADCARCTGCADCMGCADCTDCARCTRCARCTGCADCTDCTRCTRCADCADCTDCADCADCARCTGCADCTGCTGCTDCADCTRWKFNAQQATV